MADTILPALLNGEKPFFGRRRDAIAAGARYYINFGARNSCLHGHEPAIRLVSNTGCVLCWREKWEKNAEAHAARRKIFYDLNRDRLNEDQRRKYASNPEKYRQMVKEYAVKNRDKIDAYNAKWRADNADYLRRYYNIWRWSNPEKIAAKSHKRRAAKLGSEKHFTDEDIATLYVAQNGCCAYCQTDISEGFDADHIIALVNGGSNGPENIALACVSCNRSKGNRPVISWLTKRFGITEFYHPITREAFHEAA